MEVATTHRHNLDSWLTAKTSGCQLPGTAVKRQNGIPYITGLHLPHILAVGFLRLPLQSSARIHLIL